MLRLTKIAVLSLFLGFLVSEPIAVMAGDWPMEMYNSAKTGYNPQEKKLKPPLKLKWNFKEARLGFGPVIDENNIYFAGVDGKIVSLNKITGSLVWENALTFEKDGKSYESSANSSPIIDESTLYVSGTFGKILAFEKTTGTIIWQIEDENYRPLSIWKDLLLMSTYEGNIVALDKKTGKSVWSYQLKEKPGEMTASEKGIFVDEYNGGNYVYTLYSINPDTGQLNWKLETGKNSNRMTYDKDLNRLFSLTTGGELFALDPNNGSIIWKTKVHLGNVAFATSPAVDDKYVYLTSADHGEVIAVSKNDGKIIWRQGSIQQVIITDPIVVNGVVYVGGQGGIFASIDRETGKILWQYDSNDIVTATAAVSDGILYIGGRDGKGLYAFESQNPGVYVSESGLPENSDKAPGAKLNLSLAGPVIIYLLWIAGAIFYVNRIRSKRFQTDELYRFASQMASAGKSQQEITAALRQAGWSEAEIDAAASPKIPWWGKMFVLSSGVGVFLLSVLFLSGVAIGFLWFTQEHSSWPIFYNLGNWYGNILLSRAIMPLVITVSLMITLVYLWWLGITKKVLTGRIATIANILLLVSLGLTALITLFGIILILMIAMGKIN